MKEIFNNPVGGCSIVFTVNQKYLRPALTLMESIAAQAEPSDVYNFFILHDNISAFSQEIVEEYATQLGVSVRFIDLSSLRINGPASFHFTKDMYYRLLIPTLFEEWERILYLDVDILALGKIETLLSAAKKEKALAAVQDCFVPNIFPGHAEALLKSRNPEHYFNSGVIVFNCQQISEEDVFESLEKIGQYTRLPDQDILNVHYQGRVSLLSEKHCFLLSNGSASREMPKGDTAENPILVHYTGHFKPWSEDIREDNDTYGYLKEYQKVRAVVDAKLEEIFLKVAKREFSKK